jgi:hypothetical protein
VVAFALLLLAACTHPINKTLHGGLNHATMTEVQAKLGKPVRRRANEDRTTCWQFQ